MKIRHIRELKEKSGSKYKNIITERDGMKFHSEKEAEFYDDLKIAQHPDGPVLYFLRQVPFHLPGNVKYVCDFHVVYKDGNIEFFDVKGKRTAQYIRNKKMVEALYPVRIIER